MSPGKCASQAGHAYLGAFSKSLVDRPAIAHAYAAEDPGTKVALKASGTELFRAAAEAAQAGIPAYLVIDSGCQNFFGGEPIPTALGFGPATAEELPKYLRRLKLL